MFGAIAAKKLLPMYKTDLIYNPLPLYHSSGGVLGVGPAIAFGITSYIGEMCRYMLCAPATNFDQDHKVRVMVGNGLRPAIWKQFVHRFHVPQIVELYAATEGNANIVNVDGTIGAVGFLPRILPESFSPIALVRVDASTGELVRSGPDSLCVRCGPGMDILVFFGMVQLQVLLLSGEPGMFVGIIKEGDPTREYHGYVDRQASEKNVARNVLSVGDKVFVSGDVMVMDDKGYLFFKDRTGDTFRLTFFPILHFTNSKVPHCEGKAGMATILDVDDSLDIPALGRTLALTLPTYAMPLFLRIAKKLEMTVWMMDDADDDGLDGWMAEKSLRFKFLLAVF
ncbi:hypothetical protein B566_EDAN005960 [Ephemera danica]|nr:hypothetical protein B566_EDAN005960 [Ephemera danica]